MKVKFSRGISTPDTYDNITTAIRKKKKSGMRSWKYQKSLAKIYPSGCSSVTNLAMSDRQDLWDSWHQHQSILHHIFQEIEGSWSLFAQKHIKIWNLKNEKITASCRSKLTCKIKFAFEALSISSVETVLWIKPEQITCLVEYSIPTIGVSK